MHVLFASHSSRLAGGAEYCLLELVEVLCASRPTWRISVLLPGPGSLATQLQHRGCHTVFVDMPWWASFGRPQNTRTTIRNLLGILRKVPRATRTIRAINCDFIVVNTLVSPTAAIVAKLLGLPVIWMAQEFADRDHGMWFYLGYARTIHLISQLAEVVLVPSSAVAGHLKPLLRQQPVTVHQSVHLAGLTYRTRSPGPRLRLLVIGRITESKGQALALEVLDHLIKMGVDACIRFIGSDDPQYLSELHYWTDARALVERVEFLPETDSISAAFEQSDIFLMCSKEEALGRVTIEACKAGLIVVGFASGGTIEILQDGAGTLVAPGDTLAMAKAIVNLIHHPGFPNGLGLRAAADVSSRYNPTRYADEFTAVASRLRRKT